KINFTPVVRFEHASDRNGIVNWKFGIIGKPTSFLSLKGNVESSSRYPNFNELYYPDEGFIRGNENLEKEDAINYDVGFVLRSKTSSLEAAYFYNDIDNSIIFVPISATTIQPVNTYKVKSQGVEIQTTVTPWEYAWIEASYTYLKANFASNNNQLPGRPKHKLGTRFNGKYKWLSGYYEIAYQDDLPINTQNTTFISARTRMDCGLTATIKKNYYASADFKNITNVQIYDARGYPLPRFGFFVTVGANI
ncbi:TonB-dependent receptor, partial [bacterium]|nr:TonB-dependent receptor [bacterium]